MLFITWKAINRLCDELFRENTNIYSNSMSFLCIDTTQVVEILAQARQEPAYSS